MGLSIPFYTEQYILFWWQYKLSFTVLVYRKHCNRDAMIRNSVYNTTWCQAESQLLVLWQSLWLCLSCPLTSTWHGLLAVTGTTTRSGWIMKGKKHHYHELKKLHPKQWIIMAPALYCIMMCLMLYFWLFTQWHKNYLNCKIKNK